MKKKELCSKAGISPSSLTKMGKNGHVTTEVLAKICGALGCTVDDIMDIIPNESE
jgi:DNA-binding Xre family transcriptional regulator